MKIVILAAGKGKRLNNFQRDKNPKCLLEIGGKRLIEHILGALRSSQIEGIIVVVGYMKNKIIDYLKNGYQDSEITFVENSRYADTGSLYSLSLAQPHLDKDDFIFMDADVLLHPDLLSKMIKSKEKNALLYSPAPKLGKEEVKVYGRRDIATGIGKNLACKDRLMGEAVGIVKVSKESCGLFKKLVKEILEVSCNCEHEDLTQKLCERSLVSLVSSDGLPWIEIDFPQDIKRAKNEIWPEINKK